VTDAYLSLRGITRRFTDTVGVFGIDLEVAKGEAVCLLGPSGCGKTTVLRIIAGLLEPDAGSLVMQGRDVTAQPVHRRDIGMVFQSWALFSHLSVMRNVEFGLAMRHVGRAERRQRAGAMLELVGLSALADRKPAQLSGGQQQRVALARALAISPNLLLLDEPMSSLDYNTRLELRREIRKLQRALDVTAVYVTHDYSEALAVADRTVLMQAGRILEQAPTRRLFEHPTTDYAARFLGLHNVVPARVVAIDDTHVAVEGAGGLAGRVTRDPAFAPPAVGATVSLCFDQWSAGLGQGPGAVAVTVQDCVAEHACTRIVTRLGGDAGVAISVLLSGLQAPPQTGADRLWIDWDRVWLLQSAPP
jgi:putative spermidine/putrescine transport system ATP-binding protein